MKVFEYCYILYFQGLKKEAIEDCTKAVELNPNYVKAYIRRAKLYEENDKLDEALEDYKKILELDPGYSEARGATLVCFPFFALYFNTRNLFYI